MVELSKSRRNKLKKEIRKQIEKQKLMEELIKEVEAEMAEEELENKAETLKKEIEKFQETSRKREYNKYEYNHKISELINRLHEAKDGGVLTKEEYYKLLNKIKK